MRKTLPAAVILCFLCDLSGMAAGSVYAKEYKIGYVNLAKVFEDYKKTKDAEKILTDKGNTKTAERTKMLEELKKLKDEQALLSDKGKAEKQTIIDNKAKALQDFDKKTREDLYKERNDALSGIMKDIEKVVEAYAKEAGYDMVVDTRMLLYGSEQNDLTAEVLGRLNK